MAGRGDWPQRRGWYLRWGEASNLERLGIIWDGHRELIVGIGLVAFATAVWWFWSDVTAFGSWLLAHSTEVRNLTLSAGVVGAGVGVWVAFRRSQADRNRAETDRLRQVTDSFEGAVTLLGRQDRSVRLGAIYALERIARQNPDEHWPIMETLTAYVREWSERRELEARTKKEPSTQDDGDAKSGQEQTDEGQPQEASAHPPAPADVQAIFTVLGRRRVEHEASSAASERRLNLSRAYLVGTKPDPPPERRFGRVVLVGAHLEGAHLEGADLRAVDLIEANLKVANLIGANLTEANLEKSNLEKANLAGADLVGANLKGANLRWANLTGAKLGRANLAGADLCLVNLERANLAGANLQAASLDRARLLGASLEEAKLGKADLKGADLLGARLGSAELMMAKLGGARLKGANLAGAGLPGADLKGANLVSASLVEADLVAANLKEVELEAANLHGAYLGLANLATAQGLIQEQLDSAIGNEDTKIPEGLTRPAHWSK